MGKVTISRIEIDGGSGSCRVFLSDGNELECLQRVAPSPCSPDDLMRVEIDAIICKPKDAAD